jgi:acetylornithine deacetylase/succinyl-diaminopimelate desuccinylase-like protein
MLTLVAAAALAATDLKPVYAEITKRHAESIARLQKWIALPTIAAEGLNAEEGVTRMIELLKEAGFPSAERLGTDGKPGVFAAWDVGAKRTVGLYFMLDVKQFDSREWSSPPLEARLVDRPGVGKVMIGRGAENQKGPEAAFLAALHAIRGAGQKPPVNLVLVAEGEEEIGSPHFPQIVHQPEVEKALAKAALVVMPAASQGLDGAVDIPLGSKGVIEVELVSSGEKWGRGPSHDVHSANRARLDSPAFHLVQALATLVTPEGDPAIDGFADKTKRLSPAEEKMVDDAAKREKEADEKKQLGVARWAHDASWRDALAAIASKPTVNIEGLVAGYTGPGGKTVLPHRAVAKLDLRLVPDMTADGALGALKAHLQKRGFADIEVNMTGGYDPNMTAADSVLTRKALATYKQRGIDAHLLPRSGGSYPGYVFTNPPLSLPAGRFGLGHGDGAHAPDEYLLIESANPKLFGWDDSVKCYVDFLYAVAE